MRNNLLIFFIIFGSHFSQATDSPLTLPYPEARGELFSQWVSEIERLDGEGLTPRFNRPQNWITTNQKLRAEAVQANTLFQWVRAYKRLDATYPNLHARLYFDDFLNQDRAEGVARFDFEIAPQLTSRDQAHYQYFVSKTFDNSFLVLGDEITAINDISIATLQDENFIFCKFPLKSQCALELFNQFSKELLFWTRDQKLDVTVRRNHKLMTFSSRVSIEKSQSKSNNQIRECSTEGRHYRDFELTYKGFNLCAFTSKKYPNTIVVRIPSFVYTPDDPITRLEAEVEYFWFNFWKENSQRFKTIIFDVIGNYGGNSPIPYYALVALKPYQEQYVQFKKIKEFEQPDIFDSLFWGDNGKKIWFEDLKKSGMWNATKEGEFLPPVPQFCRHQDRNCNAGLFEPYPHQFRGQIKILLDQWCISSCVGFVDNLARLYPNKIQFFGHEDSGDSTYSRLTLALDDSSRDLKISTLPLSRAKKPESSHLVLRQVLSLTRSTSRSGEVLSGKPQKISKWIPRSWNEDTQKWSANVFRASLKGEMEKHIKK